MAELTGANGADVVPFGTEAGIAEFWDTLEIQIFQALDAFAKQQAEQGLDPSLFVGETAKGLRLMEVMARRYDAVVTNPPYMSARAVSISTRISPRGRLSAADAGGSTASGKPLSWMMASVAIRISPAGATRRLHQLPKPSR